MQVPMTYPLSGAAPSLATAMHPLNRAASGAAKGLVGRRISRRGERETFEARADFKRVANYAEQLKPRREIAGLGRIQPLLAQMLARDIKRVHHEQMKRIVE